MNAMNFNNNWRLLLLVCSVGGSLLLMLLLSPIVQDPAYHGFADYRMYFRIPNFHNVVSNIFFLIVGLIGIRFCLRTELGQAQRAWLVFFVGVALVSVGSSYYHWHPNDATLVWDRTPMTIAFMGMFVALLTEYIDMPLVARLLVPALLLGLGSVIYWVWWNDLRLYVWVQFFPLLTIPLVMLLFKPRYSHQWLLLVALIWYVLAKILEAADRLIFEISRELLGGHALKHVFAALGCLTILRMLQARQVRRDITT